jgi:hypothetical protein
VFTASSTDPKAGETLVQNVTCDSAVGYGGIGISYAGNAPIPKENQWGLLYSTAVGSSQASWYRVVSAGYDGTNTRVTLVGPDWNGGTGAAANPVRLIVIPGVTGVYTTTVELDNDVIWSK